MDSIAKSHILKRQKLLDDMKRNFREAARDNVIVSRAFDIVGAEHLSEEFAWLMAAMALLEQNEQLMKIAQIDLATMPPVIIKEL